jgi:hypothetical protein
MNALSRVVHQARISAVALLIVPVMVSAGVASGVQTASASSCSISTWLVGNPIGPGFRAYASWGPNCSTSYHNTLAIYEQIGPNDWYDVYGETEPPLAHLNGASIPTFASLVACYNHGVGYYKSLAYIGGIWQWSTGQYCP